MMVFLVVDYCISQKIELRVQVEQTIWNFPIFIQSSLSCACLFVHFIFTKSTGKTFKSSSKSNSKKQQKKMKWEKAFVLWSNSVKNLQRIEDFFILSLFYMFFSGITTSLKCHFVLVFFYTCFDSIIEDEIYRKSQTLTLKYHTHFPVKSFSYNKIQQDFISLSLTLSHSHSFCACFFCDSFSNENTKNTWVCGMVVKAIVQN